VLRFAERVGGNVWSSPLSRSAGEGARRAGEGLRRRSISPLAPLLLTLLAACSEYGVKRPDPAAPADPPGVDPDADFGKPPDWNDCYAGFYGQYYNLPVDHPDVEPDEDAQVPGDPDTLDWWSPERLAFRRFDGTLDFGSNWWPVDEGLEGDPLYFAARWTGWMRAWSGTTVTVTLGSVNDSWVLADKSVVVTNVGDTEFEPATERFDLAAGQYPFDVRFAQRAGEESAFRFRVLGGDVSICYPDFSDG
jgi:hypothetical protein